MLFPTIEFALFFAAVYVAWWSLEGRETPRKLLLLVASWFFYGMAAGAGFLLLLGVMTLLPWRLGNLVAAEASPGRRRFYVGLHAGTALFALSWFKYYDFLRESLDATLGWLSPALSPPALEILLPIGISFIAFQGITYTADIHRGLVKPAPLLDVALFTAFFPNLLSGPIARAGTMLPQFAGAGPRRVLTPYLAVGLFLTGLFKKLILSTYLSTHAVDPFFADPTLFTAPAACLGILAYSVQIYCDFSGYSDMAIACALLLGIRLPANFDRPYAALNLREFWRGWHISLSTWLRDYLYIPLGGSRRGTRRTMINLMVTMLLGGLWHGASWTFLAWGALHGLGQAALHAVGGRRWAFHRLSPRARQATAWAGTFAFVSVAWVFFRAPDMSTALLALRTAAMGGGHQGIELFVPVVIGLVLAVQLSGRPVPTLLAEWLCRQPLAIRGAATAALLVLILKMSPPEVPPFLYFRF
jgi:D-alanyl-lipoteichoic acid acyltransferase DltB (MBOAT superfamily)